MIDGDEAAGHDGWGLGRHGPGRGGRSACRSGASPRNHGEIVRTLGALAEGLEGQNEVSRDSVGRLIGILQTMSGSIASADDATFTAIMREAGLLIRAVRERQTYFSQFTVH